MTPSRSRALHLIVVAALGAGVLQLASVPAAAPPAVAAAARSSAPLAVHAPADGAVVRTPDGSVTFTGTGQPGGKVSVVQGSKVLGSAPVGADGSWTVTTTLPTAALRLDVYHKAVASQSGISDRTALSITVERPSAPAPVAIESPADGATVRTSDKTVEFRGSGPAGGIVTVMNGSRRLGTTTVPTGGSWSIPTVLNHGTHALTIWTKSAPTGPATSRSWSVTVEPTADQTFRQLSPLQGDTVQDGFVPFTGTGKAGGRVSVHLGSWSRGSATVASDGTWDLAAWVSNHPGTYPFTTYYKADPTSSSAVPLVTVLTVR